MGKQTGPERRNVISGERMRKVTEIISSQTNRWDGIAIFSVEPIGTGTQLIYPLKPKRKGTTITFNCLARNGDAGYIFWGDARNGNKIYCLIEERKGRERKVKSCSRDERSRDRKWITICEPKVTGTLNGFEFGNRKEREPEMFRDASRIRFCVPHPEGKTGGASRRPTENASRGPVRPAVPPKMRPASRFSK